MTAPLWLVLAFGLVAAAYASVGLGGATAYAAILTLTTVPVEQVPPLVLTLNLVVAGGAFWGRRRIGPETAVLLRPLVLGSIPAAFAGGLVPLRDRELLLVLALALLLAALRFLFGPLFEGRRPAAFGIRRPDKRALFGLGVALGLVAGMTGIGGGVYLGPILLLTGWADLRTTPAVTSGFVLLNSVAALAAHLTRVDPIPGLWIPLVAAVVAGSVLATTAFLRWLSPPWLQRTFGVVLLAVAVLNGVKAL